jgi:hypothetical protein
MEKGQAAQEEHSRVQEMQGNNGGGKWIGT